eukprot:12407004-Karenia_brevis.AAC.1
MHDDPEGGTDLHSSTPLTPPVSPLGARAGHGEQGGWCAGAFSGAAACLLLLLLLLLAAAFCTALAALAAWRQRLANDGDGDGDDDD